MPKDPPSTQILRSSRRRSVFVAVQKPATRRRLLSGLSGRHSVFPGVQLHNGLFNEQRRGGGVNRDRDRDEDVLQLTWPANTTTFDPLRVLQAGEVARLMRGANHPSHTRQPPCPVARVPFLSSCAGIRKRDEIMSVQIRTQTLHKSRSGLAAGHCLLLYVTGTSSQGSYEYAVSTVAGTPPQPPHCEGCECIVETGVSGKIMTSCRTFGSECALFYHGLHAVGMKNEE